MLRMESDNFFILDQRQPILNRVRSISVFVGTYQIYPLHVHQASFIGRVSRSKSGSNTHRFIASIS